MGDTDLVTFYSDMIAAVSLRQWANIKGAYSLAPSFQKGFHPSELPERREGGY